MKINPAKILSFAASYLENEDRVCRVCGEYFNVRSAQWAYDDWWQNQCEDYTYEEEFPEKDICDSCAIQETEEEYY